MLWSLILLIFFSYISYLFPNVLYPEMAKEKGFGLGTIGLIFSLFPIGQITTSIYLGKNMSQIGRKKIIFFGCLLLAAT